MSNDKLELVTYHAVNRYCERILAVEIDGEFEDEKAKAQAYCSHLGVTLEELRRRIFTKGLALAVDMRLPRFANKEFFAIIDLETGAIVTIARPRARRAHWRNVLTKHEFRKKCLREERRLRLIEQSKPKK